MDEEKKQKSNVICVPLRSVLNIVCKTVGLAALK